MGIKIRIMYLIIVITVTTVSMRTPKLPGLEGERSSGGNDHRNDKSMVTNAGSSSEDERSDHSSTNEKNGIGTESMSASSTSRYRYRKARDFKAKGKFRSRGIGRYGTMSSESTHFVIKGKIDRHGRRKPTKSKFKTRGKEKKYSRRINDNRFDIKGGLYERRQHEGMGDYQANGSYIYMKLQTNQQNGSKNKTNHDFESKSHSDASNQNQNNNWGTVEISTFR